MPHYEQIRRATLVIVRGPGFRAGMLIYRGAVIETAPILRRWVLGCNAAEAIEQLQARGYLVARSGPMAEASDAVQRLLRTE